MPNKQKLRKWRVYGAVAGTKYLGEFEAATKEEAEALALASEVCYVSLCHHCASECDDPEIQEVNAEPAEEE